MECKMLESFKSQFPGVSDEVALQFLYSRNFCLEKSAKLYCDYLKRIRDDCALRSDPDELAAGLITRKISAGNYEKEYKNEESVGSGILVLDFRKHIYESKVPDATQASVFYAMHLFTHNTRVQRMGFTLLCDMRDCKWRNIDFSLLFGMVDDAQNALPVRARRILICYNKWWIGLLIHLVLLFFGAEVSGAISMCQDPSSYLIPDQLPTTIGGRMVVDYDVLAKEIGRLRLKMFQESEWENKHLFDFDPETACISTSMDFSGAECVENDPRAIMEAFYKSMSRFDICRLLPRETKAFRTQSYSKAKFLELMKKAGKGNYKQKLLSKNHQYYNENKHAPGPGKLVSRDPIFYGQHAQKNIGFYT